MIKAITSSIFTMLLSICFSQGYGLDWAISATDTIERGYAVQCQAQVVDKDGNLYSIGTFANSADFDPSAAEYELMSRSSDIDLFLAKYDSLNNLIWVKGIGGRAEEQVSSIALDNAGNIVIVGEYRGKLFYDADQDSVFLDAPYSFGPQYYTWPYYGYIMKYDSNGAFLWANHIPSSFKVQPSEVVVDYADNIIVTGKFTDQARFGTNYQDTLFSNGGTDIFIAKFDSIGQHIWSNSIGGIDDDEGIELAIDSTNSIYLSGIIHDTVDMDPSSAVALENATNDHSFLAKYDSTGEYFWSHSFHVGNLKISDVQVDNSNDIVFTGECYNNTNYPYDFDPGPAVVNLPISGWGAYIEKMDTAGNFIWAQQVGGNTHLPKYLTISSSDEIFVTGGYSSFSSPDDLFISKHDNSGNELFMDIITGNVVNAVSGISLISDERPVITGYFRGVTDFDPNSGVSNLATLNGSVTSTYFMGFVANYSAVGGFLDAFSIGNNYFYGSSVGLNDYGTCIKLDSDKNIYASGYFEGPTDFDPSSSEAILETYPINNNPSTLYHSTSVFVAKYDSLSNYIWSFQIDSVNGRTSHEINSLDELYLVTTLGGAADIDPSANTMTLTPDYIDGAVMKYDENGNLLWGFNFAAEAASSYSFVRGVVLDTAENILVSGSFDGTLNFNPLGSAVLQTAQTGSNFFLAKYDGNGILIWFQQMGQIPVGNVEITYSNDILITGVASGTIDFDLSPGVNSLSFTAPSDIYTALYTDSGDLQWANVMGCIWIDNISEIRVGDEHFYMFGRFKDSIDLDPSPNEHMIYNPGTMSTFLARYTISDGAFNWGFSIGENPSTTQHNSLDLDENENIALLGQFRAGNLYGPSLSFMDFDPSSNSTAFTSNEVPLSFASYFVSLYDSLGNYSWATDFKGALDINQNFGGDIIFDDGQIFTTGGFKYHTDFTPSNLSNPLVSHSEFDFFLTKFSGCTTKYTHDTLTVCGSYSWYNQEYATSGDYTKITPQANGCDSVLLLNLTVIPIDTTTFPVTECDSFTWNNGITYYTSGIYSQVLTAVSGCDSVILLDLSISASLPADIIDITQCDSFTWTDGVTYTSSGLYEQTLLTSAGCDSLVFLNLTIPPNNSTVSYVSNCGEYTANNGITYSTSGTYIETFQNSSGCDSINELNLIILPIDSTSTSVTVCNSYTSSAGITYSTSGTYFETFQNSGGCDSINELNLTILPIDSTSTSVTVCTSYTSSAGITYSTSGTYIETFQNSSGCDSINELNLIILPIDSTSTSVTVCNSYTSSAGITYSTSGTYFETFQNSGGCDSINELNLTILPLDSTSLFITECDSFTWSNGVTYTSSGIYYQTLTSNSGCDSTIELNLTLETISNALVAQLNDTTIECSNLGVNYQWIDCGNQSSISGANAPIFSPDYNGFFAVIIDDGVCTDTSSCIEIASVGLGEIQNSSVLLYPNPTSGKVFIEFDETRKGLIVHVLDASGRQVMSREFNNTSTMELDFNVAKGLYFINVQDSNELLYQFKVIKE